MTISLSDRVRACRVPPTSRAAIERKHAVRSFLIDGTGKAAHIGRCYSQFTFTVNGDCMADFLDEKRKEIQARLKELRPLVDEFNRLEAAERALSGVDATPGSTSAPAATRRTRRASGTRSTSGNGRRGRPRGSGTRAQEALKLVTQRPGITIPELADSMGIKQNYLYRVMPTLAEEGRVIKSGRGWHPRDGESGGA
jgi:hypothetical protein